MNSIEYDEGAMSAEERTRILDDLARDKNFSNYEAYKESSARKMGFRDWAEVRKKIQEKKDRDLGSYFYRGQVQIIHNN